MRKNILLSLLIFCSLFSCHRNASINNVLKLSKNNHDELEKVLSHYIASNDKRKLEAARFLIANMGYNKFYYDGEIITYYDTIIHMYDSLRNTADTFLEDFPIIAQQWDSIVKIYGIVDPSKMDKIYDYEILKADFLIRNIDEAFEAWENSPFYNPENFDLFCEYILPHRIQHEPVEEFRSHYYKSMKIIADTATTIRNIILGFHNELYINREYCVSELLHDYPLELPISKMEIGRRGACHQITAFQALVMRAAGLPVTIDRAVWADHSQEHSWNVLMLDNGKTFPFEALGSDSIQFTYKPAKIFRKTYSYSFELMNKLQEKDIPASFLIFDEKDVTHEYVDTYDITIPISFVPETCKRKKQGIICVFDNGELRPVYWGNIKDKKIHFENMASEVIYIGAFLDNGKIIQVTEPFLLQKDGKIKAMNPDDII